MDLTVFILKKNLIRSFKENNNKQELESLRPKLICFYVPK